MQKRSPLELAVERHRSEDLAEAERLYKEVLSADPRNGRAWYLLGVLHNQKNRVTQAQECLERSVGHTPLDDEAWFQLGRVYFGSKKYIQARQAFSEAALLRTNNATYFNAIGNAELHMDRPNVAYRYYEIAHGINPSDLSILNNLGHVCRLLKRFDLSEKYLTQATLLDPHSKHAWNNLGLLHKDFGDLSKSLLSLNKALQVDSAFADALNNIGTVFRLMGRWTEAERYFEQSLQSSPNNLTAIRNLCSLLNDQRRYADAQRLLEGIPHEALAMPEVLLDLCQTKIYSCDWENLGDHLTTIRTAILEGKLANKPFQMLSIWDDPSLHLTVAEGYAKTKFPGLKSQNVPSASATQHKQNERIRVAYFSSDFQFHPVAQLLVGLIEHHDKSKFEVFSFSNGPERDDSFRYRLKNASDHFIGIKSLSDEEVYAKVRGENIDIAIDLSGYTIGGRTRVFSMRCAPVQINFLGYPGSMGSEYYDYIIADPVIIPSGFEAFYKENILRLKHTYQPNDRSRPTSKNPPNKASLGLPPKGFIYCCFNNNYKITEEIFLCWMRILKRVKGSVLWLLQDNDLATKNLKEYASRLGVGAERLIFAQRAEFSEYLSRQVCADLFLDTFPYNAHTTASDALWMGVPLLTYQGKSFASRVASSLLQCSNLNELVTHSLEEYEEKAVNFGNNPNLLEPIRRQLEAERNQNALFDILEYTKAFEDCLNFAIKSDTNLP